MNIKILLLILVIISIIVGVIFYLGPREKFNIPLRSSSAWDWNLGPGYGAGYGTGYAMWGMWPANLPREPWKNWMWGRRPLIFTTPFTPVPQIEYNDTPTLSSKPSSNYDISLLPVGDAVKLAINGIAGKTLQLDRHRNYYFHIYTPGTTVVITDGINNITEPIESGTLQLRFENDDPAQLYYTIPNEPSSGGIIYLNSTRWK